MMDTILSESTITKFNDDKIKQIVLDGKCSEKLKENMLSSSLQWNEEKINKLFLSSLRTISKFPNLDSECKNVKKILCLGKVQSGKTAFFIATMALAMDNGYNLFYVLGGTKNNLLDQNKGRIKREFINNRDVYITSINALNEEDIRQKINSGIKVIVMVLKGKNKNADKNLQRLETVTEKLSDIPSIVVDDEGDQVSLGNRKKSAAIYSGIVNVLNKIEVGAYLSVTATPQANLLVSTINVISPDYCVMIDPGDGYTGANTFHDSKENKLVEVISDSDDFIDSVPLSFRKAFFFFLVGCAIQRARNCNERYSMLIHPSASTKVQHDIYIKVYNLINEIKKSILPFSIGYEQLVESISKALGDFTERIDNLPDLADIINIINENLIRTGIFEINSPSDMDLDQEDFCSYKIYIGGNMLERGITIENLSVTYIYRVAKKDNAVDTMFQRARWFGYKDKYLSICKVYMPVEMRQMFIDMTEHENFLWLTLKDYLNKNDNIKKFPRVFELETSKNLILTRKTISKTVEVGGINQGYVYDLSIWYEKKDEIINNTQLWDHFWNNHEGDIREYGNQKHVFYWVKITNLINEVLHYYSFPKAARKVNALYIKSLLNSVENGLLDDSIVVIRMRKGVNQFRSLDLSRKAVKELPQSYDIKSNYPGDRRILEDKLCLQVHYVYTNREKKEELIPMIAINNPCDAIRVNFVTGDNQYETN